MVREVTLPDRRNCFEIVSPNRTFLLQSENEKDLQDWISTLQTAIGKALNNDEKPEMSTKTQQVDTLVHGDKSPNAEDALGVLRRVAGNVFFFVCFLRVDFEGGWVRK
jgi:hypothetical protein